MYTVGKHRELRVCAQLFPLLGAGGEGLLTSVNLIKQPLQAYQTPTPKVILDAIGLTAEMTSQPAKQKGLPSISSALPVLSPLVLPALH